MDRIVARVEKICGPQEHQVDAIVNYDHTMIYPEIEECYAAAVARLEEAYYQTVTRYSGSAFMRLKLGKVYGQSTGPHVFESAEDAQRFLDGTSE